MLVHALGGLAQPTKIYSHGDPTPDEQYMLELVNRARANPAEEGIRLMDTEDQRVQFAYQFFQINKASTKQAFASYPNRPPLAFHPALIAAARNHTADMIQANFQGHTSSNGDDLTKRFQKVGYQSQGMYGENVAAYSESVWHGHCGLNVDWGEQNQIDLGHRENIMNFKQYVFTEIGVGIVRTNGGLQSGTVGPYVITQTFGMRQTRYITGVVYADANNNGFYDQGEGLAGVEVKPNDGEFYAVTSSSGGYAIPFSGNGSVVIAASGGPLQSPMTKTISFNNENIKVDFVPSAQPPAAVSTLSPANNSSNIESPLTLTWRSVRDVSSYEVELSTSQSFSGSGVTRLTTTDTSILAPKLPCSVPVYWRVRASNDVGSGAWSSVWQFRLRQVTSQVPGVITPSQTANVPVESYETRFTWNAASNNADRYHIVIRRSGSIHFQDSTITDTTTTVTAITEPGNYSWSVRAGNACGWHSYTTSVPFVVTLTSVEETTSLALSAFQIPSPYSGDGTISIPPDDQPRMCTIVDGLGAIVATVVVPATAESIVVPALRTANSGIYMASLDRAGKRQTAAFFIAR